MLLDDLLAVSKMPCYCDGSCTETNSSLQKMFKKLQMLLKFQCSVAVRVSIWGVSLKL